MVQPFSLAIACERDTQSATCFCAKHIIAAGIKRVVFIEPFPKSYAEQLHADAIVIGKSNDPEKVVFEPFIGITPFRYRDLFARERRKDDAGIFRLWAEGQPRPIVKYTVATYVQNAGAAVKLFNEAVRAKTKDGVLQVVPLEREIINAAGAERENC
jgi:hypothetical protein